MSDKLSLEDKLFKYAERGYSVLLSGLHGVGKTVLTEKTFDKMGWKYLTLNSATLNPYTDVTGVPMEGETINSTTNEKVSCLVKRLPEIFAADELDAIFFDEISRASKETMNGLFQLLQFKSINGYKLNRLKVIWGAYNPYNPENDEDEQTYHVMQLDPAFQDRFRIHIELPYELNKPYLLDKHKDTATPFINWWEELPNELKLHCSPRRLEESIIVFKDGFDLDDVLYHDDLKPVLHNLKEKIAINSSEQHINYFIDTLSRKNIESAAELINIENVEIVINAIKSKKLKPVYLKAINQDLLAKVIVKNEDTKLEKIIYALKEKDNEFILSPLAENVLMARKEALDNAVLNVFNDTENQLKIVIDNDNVNSIIAQFCNIVFNIIWEYHDTCINNNVSKIDLNLDLIYEKLKSNEHFKVLYKKIVLLWHSWKIDNQAGNDKLIYEKQINLLSNLKNELHCVLLGSLFKNVLLDKTYKVFKENICNNYDEFKNIVLCNPDNVLGKRKWFYYGCFEDGKTVSKMTYSFFEGNKSLMNVNTLINGYKW